MVARRVEISNRLIRELRPRTDLFPSWLFVGTPKRAEEASSVPSMQEAASLMGVGDRLRSLGAGTDAALGRLDVEDLLVELLERVRVVVDADTAAVLLLDVAAQELVA